MQASGGQGTRNCVSCGRPISFDANVCPYCGHDYRMQMMAPVQQKKDSGLPVAGGVLILISSLGFLVMGGLMAAGGSVMWDFGGGAAVACGALLLVLGVIALLGSIFAIQKRNWVIALIAGIIVLPSILGLIGLILVAVSREAFDS